MSVINLDGSEYEIEHLSDNARQQLIYIRHIDERLSEIRSTIVIYQVAGRGLEGSDRETVEAKVQECHLETAMLNAARGQFLRGFRDSLN